jgi:benzoate-CoA ligase family protein
MKSLYAELPHHLNVASHLIEQNIRAGYADKQAYLFRDGSLSFGQLRQYVSRMSALLQERGLEWEQRVALLLPDSPELAIAFWGSVWAGAVPVPINTAYSPDDIRYILADCRAKIVVTNRAWHAQFSDQLAAFQERLIIVDETPSLLSRLDTLLQEPAAALTTRDDVAFWLYTSGSTGRPKGVMHLHHDMLICTELYAKNILGMHAGDLTYSVARIPFAYGLGNTLYMPLAVGATAILADASNAFDIIADLHHYRPTIFFAIPGIYSAILNVQELAPLDASSLRLCISAAEQLPPSLWYQWRERIGLEICEGIGTTELLHIFLSNTPGQCKPGSSGRCVPGYTARVVDMDGAPVQPGVIGDLEVGGESLMLGYWNRHQETCAAIFGNYMKTGDKYFVDADGNYYFAGRHDDSFRVNGHWILPFEVEDVLLQSSVIQDTAVLAMVDELSGQTSVIAYIVLHADSAPSAELQRSLRKQAKQKLPHYKVPSHFIFVPAIQRTATGKIDRHRLRKQAISIMKEKETV